MKERLRRVDYGLLTRLRREPLAGATIAYCDINEKEMRALQHQMRESEKREAREKKNHWGNKSGERMFHEQCPEMK